MLRTAGRTRTSTPLRVLPGKDHLNYAQRAAAEITAMAIIGAAAWFGLPVSTTQVL